jgi:hypothetical protein
LPTSVKNDQSSPETADERQNVEQAFRESQRVSSQFIDGGAAGKAIG